MDILFYFVKETVWLLIQFLQFMMLGRAIFSFLPVREDSKLIVFLYAVTEPVIFPVRRVFELFGYSDGFIFDIPFFVTYILLSVLGIFL